MPELVPPDRVADELDLTPFEIPTAPLPTGGLDSTAGHGHHAVEQSSGFVDTVSDLSQELIVDPSFWDSMFLWDMPILAATILGLLLGTMGMYLVLARAAFVGAAVSQLAGFGVVVAIGLFGGLHGGASPDGAVRLVGLATGVLGAGLFLLPSRGRGISTDAVLAITVIGASALTLVGAGFLTREYQHIRNTLYGDAVVASSTEVGIVAVIATTILLLERRVRVRWLFVLFDSETASAQGMAVRRWMALLGFAISITVATATAGVGALVAFAFSVLPPTIALLWTKRIDRAFLVSAMLAATAAVLGYYLAFIWSLPTGPTMAAVLLFPLLLSAAYRAFRR
ncbi:MAG: ABC-type Mn2+/Zn2+ transport system permease subunit [Myxococcota bacterium]|jgi:ABC-type Mn2+/Zn2+ transport system permease subunit